MSEPTTSPTQNSGAEVFPAKIYHLLTKEKEKDLLVKEVDCSTNSQDLSQTSLKKQDLVGYLWKMFPDYSIQKEERTSKNSSQSWMNSGMVYHGECWTQNTLEHPKDVVVCILSQVIEASSPLKYFLNKEQLQSLLRRADSKTIPMPMELRRRIELQITLLSNMPELDEYLLQDPKAKDTETMVKLLHATPGAAQMLSVRRMLPSEYEKLQGFPVGWTQVDGAH